LRDAGFGIAHLESRTPHRVTRIWFLQFNAYLNTALAVLLAVADPNLPQILPVVAAAMDREPRSRHKVDAFQSQSRPKVIQSDAFDRATGYQRLDVMVVHVENMTPIEWHGRRRQRRANVTMLVNDPNGYFGVRDR